MKIREILEAMETERIAEIAKQIKGISEKPLRTALKKAGYEYSNVEPKGWHFVGTGEEPLEKSIFDYHTKATAKYRRKASNNNNVDTSNKTINKASKENNNDDIIKNDNKESRKDNDMKAEIQALIKGNKEENNRLYKGIYFDQDIAHFLDNVKHGNKSEIVNMIMRQYLVENELL